MKIWMKWLLLGLLSLILGVFVLGNTMLASIAVATVVGAAFLVLGVLQVFSALITREGIGSRLLSILLGLLLGFIGLSFLMNPFKGVISLTMLVLIMLMATGIVRITLSWHARNTRFFWPMLLSGVMSLLLAGYIWANFAATGAHLLGIILGIELLFNSSGLITLALFKRSANGTSEK